MLYYRRQHKSFVELYEETFVWPSPNHFPKHRQWYFLKYKCYHAIILLKQLFMCLPLFLEIFHQLFKVSAAVAAKSCQSCLTLCDPIDGSPPGSPIPGILQARTLEWVAISSSNALKWKVKVKSLTRVWLLMTPWTAAHQAPLSMGFSSPLPTRTPTRAARDRPAPGALPGRCPLPPGAPGGLPSMGSHRVGHDWSDLAAAAAAHSGMT